MTVKSVEEKQKRQICKDLGLVWDNDPCSKSTDTCQLGDPDLKDETIRADEYGNCIFSSIYFLLTGSKSRELWP